jgi:anaerobic ribonucleoside-triphosphate reductase
MPTCPSCGSTNLIDSEAACPDCGAGADLESRIASWIEPAGEAPAPVSGAPEAVCNACGYSGEMLPEPRGTTCPACGVTVEAGRSEPMARVSGMIECTECGRKISVTKEDEGKTVICPGCSCFLGTFKGDAKGSTASARRPRGR